MAKNLSRAAISTIDLRRCILQDMSAQLLSVVKAVRGENSELRRNFESVRGIASLLLAWDVDCIRSMCNLNTSCLRVIV